MARATGSATIRSPYSSSSPAAISQKSETSPTPETYGGRLSQLQGTKAEIQAKLEAEIAALAVQRAKFKERGTSGVAGRSNRKRVADYSKRIKTIRAYANNLDRQQLTSTSARARVYMAVQGTKDYAKAKRVSAYSYQERAKRSDTLRESRDIKREGAKAGLDTDTLTRRSYAKVREEYYTGRLRSSGTPLQKTKVTPLSESQKAFYERKRQDEIGGFLTTRHQQFEVLNRQGYTAKDLLPSLKPAVSPVRSISQESGLLPSPTFQGVGYQPGKTSNPFSRAYADFKLGIQSTFTAPSSGDPFTTSEYAARPVSYTAGQLGGFVGRGLAVTGLVKGIPSVVKTLAPIGVPLLGSKASGFAATVVTGVGISELGTRFTDTVTTRQLNEQERNLFTKYGAGAIRAGRPTTGISAVFPTYGLKTFPLDKTKVRAYAQTKGLSGGETDALISASTRVFRARALPETGAYLAASTVTELSGTVTAGKTFAANPVLFKSKGAAARYIATRVGINSAVLGAGEGTTFAYSYQRSRGIPITPASLALGAGAGAVSAGALGYGIAYKGVTSPKVGKAILTAAYVTDPGEAFGDVAAGAILRGVKGVKLPGAGIAPGGSPVFVSAITNIPTQTASISPGQTFNYEAPPPRPRPQTGLSRDPLPVTKTPYSPNLPSFSLGGGGGALTTTPPISTPTSGRRPSFIRGALPALVPAFMPAPVPAPSPAPVPSFTPAPVPSFTPAPTPTTSVIPTLTTIPSLTPSPTPSPVPTPEPTFTFTTVPTTTFRFGLPFFPVGLGRGRGKAFVSGKKTRYAPDLPSIDLGIYGKPSIPKRGFKGFEARPIPLFDEPKKKRRSKSTKKKRKAKRKKKK